MAKLPILMYHDISTYKSSEMIISVEKLDAHFAYLAEQHFQSYHFSELNDLDVFESSKNVVITFDGGYLSQLELAYPLLQKYRLKATIFAPLNFLGKKDEWDTDSKRLISLEQLKNLDNEVFEIGFSSYDYQKYDELSLVNMERDVTKCLRFGIEHQLDFSSIIAYPFGKYPKKSQVRRELFEMLDDYDFVYGLQIGNRINDFPFKNPFEIQRINVQGDFSMSTFRRKLKYNSFF